MYLLSKKSHNIPYHPMGDGLVERMNRSLLNLSQIIERNVKSTYSYSFVTQAYHFMKSYLGLTHLQTNQTPVTPDPSSYIIRLQWQFSKLREMVKANIAEASDRQSKAYSNCAKKALSVGQHVLLTNTTCGKLDP